MFGEPLPSGKAGLKFNFIKTKECGGTGELFVNGEKVSEQNMPQMHISTYSLAETFDAGRDTGPQVSKIYTGDPRERTLANPAAQRKSQVPGLEVRSGSSEGPSEGKVKGVIDEIRISLPRNLRKLDLGTGR